MSRNYNFLVGDSSPLSSEQYLALSDGSQLKDLLRRALRAFHSKGALLNEKTREQGYEIVANYIKTGAVTQEPKGRHHAERGLLLGINRHKVEGREQFYSSICLRVLSEADQYRVQLFIPLSQAYDDAISTQIVKDKAIEIIGRVLRIAVDEHLAQAQAGCSIAEIIYDKTGAELSNSLEMPQKEVSEVLLIVFDYLKKEAVILRSTSNYDLLRNGVYNTILQTSQRLRQESSAQQAALAATPSLIEIYRARNGLEKMVNMFLTLKVFSPESKKIVVDTLSEGLGAPDKTEKALLKKFQGKYDQASQRWTELLAKSLSVKGHKLLRSAVKGQGFDAEKLHQDLDANEELKALTKALELYDSCHKLLNLMRLISDETTFLCNKKSIEELLKKDILLNSTEDGEWRSFEAQLASAAGRGAATPVLSRQPVLKFDAPAQSLYPAAAQASAGDRPESLRLDATRARSSASGAQTELFSRRLGAGEASSIGVFKARPGIAAASAAAAEGERRSSAFGDESARPSADPVVLGSARASSDQVEGRQSRK